MLTHNIIYVCNIIPGRGIPQDYVMAHMHWNIASVSGGNDSLKNRDIIAKRMMPSQIEKAQHLVREWMRTH